MGIFLDHEGTEVVGVEHEDVGRAGDGIELGEGADQDLEGQAQVAREIRSGLLQLREAFRSGSLSAGERALRVLTSLTLTEAPAVQFSFESALTLLAGESIIYLRYI